MTSRESTRREALHKRAMLENEIERSSASVDEKAFMQAHLAHLWKLLEQLADGACVYPTEQSKLRRVE